MTTPAPPSEAEIEQLARAMCTLEGRDPDAPHWLNPFVLNVDDDGRLEYRTHAAWTEYAGPARIWLLARAAALTLVLTKGGQP